jgi:hypothetical protein
MVSDIFHVYPTDGYVNGHRSNYPYGEVSSPTWTSLNGSKLGPCVSPGYTGIVFEPIDEYKGDFARTYFYMTTRYYTEDGSWGTTDMTIKAEIKPWALIMLLDWHHQDTVSTKEINRNNAAYNIQDNRNPFIDRPEFADSIWGSIIGIYKQQIYNRTSARVYPSILSEEQSEVVLEKTNISVPATLIVMDVFGRKLAEYNIPGAEQQTHIDIRQLPATNVFFMLLLPDGQSIPAGRVVKL